MTTKRWLFDVPPDAAVVTTSYVTGQRMPILYVSHGFDEEEGVTWQFHCDNDDFSTAVLQLVRLDEVLRLDAGLDALATLPLGHLARRSSATAKWVIEKE